MGFRLVGWRVAGGGAGDVDLEGSGGRAGLEFGGVCQSRPVGPQTETLSVKRLFPRPLPDALTIYVI